MTPTKQQISQINSINPDILKLSEEVLKIRTKGCGMKQSVGRDICPYDMCDECYQTLCIKKAEFSGILSQCKSELDNLLKKTKISAKFKDTRKIQEWIKEMFEPRISALKVTIQFLEGVLK